LAATEAKTSNSIPRIAFLQPHSALTQVKTFSSQHHHHLHLNCRPEQAGWAWKSKPRAKSWNSSSIINEASSKRSNTTTA